MENRKINIIRDYGINSFFDSLKKENDYDGKYAVKLRKIFSKYREDNGLTDEDRDPSYGYSEDEILSAFRNDNKLIKKNLLFQIIALYYIIISVYLPIKSGNMGNMLSSLVSILCEVLIFIVYFKFQYICCYNMLHIEIGESVEILVDKEVCPKINIIEKFILGLKYDYKEEFANIIIELNSILEIELSDRTKVYIVPTLIIPIISLIGLMISIIFIFKNNLNINIATINCIISPIFLVIFISQAIINYQENSNKSLDLLKKIKFVINTYMRENSIK